MTESRKSNAGNTQPRQRTPCPWNDGKSEVERREHPTEAENALPLERRKVGSPTPGTPDRGRERPAPGMTESRKSNAGNTRPRQRTPCPWNDGKSEVERREHPTEADNALPLERRKVGSPTPGTPDRGRERPAPRTTEGMGASTTGASDYPFSSYYPRVGGSECGP
ncbi:submandibular gland secretory Glx-rich protein CB-like [Linepithema humile]|uniref:submandibular gland secretory Glx-rich protein CB-like n=1 Tax=Linepithema humile TaxID=83485 RepID=UPI00351EF906